MSFGSISSEKRSPADARGGNHAGPCRVAAYVASCTNHLQKVAAHNGTLRNSPATGSDAVNCMTLDFMCFTSSSVKDPCKSHRPSNGAVMAAPFFHFMSTLPSLKLWLTCTSNHWPAKSFLNVTAEKVGLY